MVFLQIPAETSAYTEKIKLMIVDYAPKFLGALVVLLIGIWVIKMLSKTMKKVMTVRQYDAGLVSFLTSLFSVSLNILLVITVAGMIGVNTTSFAALIAGAGLAIGAALNGSLGNLAGGVMMLIFKPFKVDDLIEAQGVTGNVKEIGIFTTVVLTPENKTVIIPNGPLSTNIITNYTTAGYLRVDTTLAIAPDQDINTAREMALRTMLSHPKVLKSPMPDVAVNKIGDGMIVLAIRPYCAQADYWDVYFGVQEMVYEAWTAAGIQGPVPHRVIINKAG